METGIYEILNTANGKWYRGQTIEGFDVRFSKHKWHLNRGDHHNEHLQRSWDKYGADAFKFSVLSRCAPEFCNELEKYWIGEDYKRSDISYNKKAGGDCNEFDASVIERRNQAIADAWTEERRSNHSKRMSGNNNPFYGKKHSDQFRKEQSERAKKQGTSNLPEVRAKISKTLTGRTLSQEHRDNLRKAAQNRPKSQCPHCGGWFTNAGMARYHGDNCKHKGD